MNIKFNHIGNITGIKTSPGISINKQNSLNVSDSVIKGQVPDEKLQKPVFKKIDTTSAINQPKRETSVLQNFCNVAATGVAGPPAFSATEILKEMAKKNVSFFKKRSIRIPGIMDKFKRIEHEKTAEIINNENKSKREALHITADGSTKIQNPTDEDLRDLAIYKGVDKSKTGEPNEILGFVMDAVQNGFSLKISNSSTDGNFVAYRHLMGRGDEQAESAKSKVLVQKKGITVLRLDPGKKFDLKKLEQNLNEFDGVYEDLGKMQNTTQQVMDAPEGIPMSQKTALAKGILAHTNAYYSSQKDKYASKHLSQLKSLVKDPGDYVKVGKMFIESLEAHGNKNAEDGYEKGLELIAGKLKDRPDDFKTFITALKNGLDYEGVTAMYNNLPQPVKKGDFETVTKAFTKHKDFSPAKYVNLTMSYATTAPIDKRIKFLESIYSQSKSHYSSDQFNYVTSDFKKLEEMSGNGNEFVKLGEMYTTMLDASNSINRRDSYSKGLDLIGSQFKDKPADFEAFIDAVKNKVGISGSVKLYELLPDTKEKISYKEAAGIFYGKKLVSSSQMETIVPSVGTSTLKERVDIAEGIYRHSRGTYSSDTWNNTKEDYEYIKTLSKDGKDFTTIGKMYVEMLDVNNKENHSSYYKPGLDLIASRFKNRPEEFKTFIKMIKDGSSISGAVEVFHNLPENIASADIEKTTELFKGRILNDKEHVKLLMPSVGNSTLEERLDIAEGIFKHSKGQYSSYTWSNTVEDYNYLKTLAKTDGDFVKIGKLYNRFLDAYGSETKSSYYRGALDLIASDLADKPEEFGVFLDLMKNKTSIRGAIKMYQMLPRPLQRGMFAAVAQVFRGSDLEDEKYVEMVMEPIEGTTVKQSHDLISNIYSHSKGRYESDRMESVTDDYKYIKEKAKDGADFLKIADCYQKTLKVRQSKSWSYSYRNGLDAILGGLKDNPEDFKIFIDYIATKKDINTAATIYNMLSTTVEKGAYEKAMDMVAKKEFVDTSAIETAFKDIKGSTVEDRYSILDGIYKHSKGQYHSDKAKYALEDYKYLEEQTGEKGVDFIDTGKKFLHILDESGSERRQSGYRKGLDFIISDLLSNPDGFEVYSRIVKGSGNVGDSVEAYKKVQQPVGSETLREREEAAAKLVGSRFEQKYDIVFRNIPKGEKPADAAILLRALTSTYYRDDYERVEGVFKKILVHKGSLNSAEPARLVEKLGLLNEKAITEALDVLSVPVKDEPYSEREAIFLTRYAAYEKQSEAFRNSLYDFKATCDGKRSGETLEDSGKRFDRFVEFLSKIGKGKFMENPESRRRAFTVISQSMEQGDLKGKSFEKILDMLQEYLIVAKNLETAAEHLAYTAKQTGDKHIQKEENEVIIGGVRLKKRGN